MKMSKERESALRTGNTPPVQPTAADVQTMAEMHANRTPDPVMDNADMEGTGLRWSNAPAAVPGAAEDVALAMRDTAPLVTDAPEDAMHTLWRSDRKRLMDGIWYVPLSEVADVLTGLTEEPDPLSEEWQAKCFPNLNIGNTGKPTPEEDSKRWIRVKVDGKNKNKNMKNINYKE